MSINYQARADGSSYLVIDDDLQFDTRDERIYHEALALPAVAIALDRVKRAGIARGLKVLICGGGDGLVLREVLKFSELESVDVYDYDSRIVNLGKTELSTLNDRSFSDSRVSVHIDDCRLGVAAALADGTRYDVIILDLVFPQCPETAKLHAIEWYRRLSSVLSSDGLLAVNAASPSKIPDAYWSIYNSIRTAEMHARPFRVCLPSFSARGYGQDWGFFLASRQAITVEEICAVQFPEQTKQLRSAEQLRKLFYFPSLVAERRSYSLPASENSDILLHYSRNSHADVHVHEVDWDGLAFDVDPALLPEPDDGCHLLPPELRMALGAGVADGERVDEQTIFERMMSIMPSLNKGQTRAMIAEFVRDPARFLQSIDFKALVDELLERASELPEKLVQELRLLKETAVDFFTDHEKLFRLGTRIITITALVVIVGNLLSPDAVYGKGGESVGSFGSEPGGFSRPMHTSYDSFDAEPSIATGNGFRNRAFGNSYVDETGMMFRPRYYTWYNRPYYGYGHNYNNSGNQNKTIKSKAVFKLSPEADVLDDGRVAITLVDNAAFILLYKDFSTVIDIKTSNAVADLAPDQAQLWRVHKEIERQISGLQKSYELKRQWIGWFSWLDFMPWYEDDQIELKNLHDMQPVLQKALTNLGDIPAYAAGQPPAPADPPVPNAVEIVSDMYLMPQAPVIAVRLVSGMAYMTDSNWYRDEALTKPITDPPYPVDFKNVLRAMLKQQLLDATVNHNRLQKNLDDANLTLNSLNSDLREYNACKVDTAIYESVDYGTGQMPLGDALKRTQTDIDRTGQRIQLIRKAMADEPRETILAEQLLKSWHFDSGLDSVGSLGASKK